MKLNKHQKEIIKHIKSGDIYDIYSYIKFFESGETISYNKANIFNAFANDTICKEYYYPSNLTPKASNVLTADAFKQKVSFGEIDASKYDSATLKLNYCSGTKDLFINDTLYKINFYDGVYIAKSFDTIIEFLSLWQYLKSEMLILEVSSDLSRETLGLFYEKDTITTNNIATSDANILQDIDYSDFSYGDNHYLTNDSYTFSEKHYTICKDFLAKRIYPTPQLNLFMQNNYKTSEESIQKSALIAAWLAIFVSIALTFTPYIYAKFSQVETTINDTESSVSENSISSNSN